MKSEIFKLLNTYKNKNHISFAMPGHKNGRGISSELRKSFFELDVTELADTESLHEPGTVLSDMLRDTAKFYGADRSFVLVNGSTSGIFTMLMSCCNPGERVLINRGCHISAINACIVLGLMPDFIPQEVIPTLGIADTPGSSVIENMLNENKYSAVFITSPTYYGLSADIEGIAKITKKRNIPLLVDEAHGAHFSGNKKIFPKPAIESGADMCVQSAHKTLNAMNQTAFLHYKRGLVDENRVKKCYSIYQTTSPSYPMIASADMARCELESSGEQMWERVLTRCNELRKNFEGTLVSPDKSWVGKYNFNDIDECRLVFNVGEYDITGFELAEKLRVEYKIDVEMADLYQIVMIPTPSNTDENFKMLEKSLREIIKNTKKRTAENEVIIPPKTERVISPAQAFYKKGKFVPVDKAVGCVAKSMVVPYPPGIAVLVPGEKITAEIIEYIQCLIKSGAEIHGLTDGEIEVEDNN